MRQAVELSPKNPEYLMRLGLVLTMQERPKVAAIFFERALKLDPNNLIVRRNLAATQWQMGRLASAQENLELILKAEPGDSQTLLLLGTGSDRRPALCRSAGSGPASQPKRCRRHIGHMR